MNASEKIEICATLLGVWLFWYLCWRPFVLDNMQERLNSIRNQLFEMAVDGKIQIDSKEYKLLREYFSRLIQYSYKLSWIRILFVMAIMKFSPWKDRIRIESPFDRILKQIEDNNLKKELTKMHQAVTWTVSIYLLLSSLIIMLPTVFLSCISLVESGIKRELKGLTTAGIKNATKNATTATLAEPTRIIEYEAGNELEPNPIAA